ncbi:ATP-dependent DNA ligase [Maioricimonas rarisocia]|uniref:ATP-dependent DNA ligase n=1 Tax=Maioricimonas rarisocia TaxID=2528026 RepID=A0A517Z6U2_9PLAN|nr:DNA polymerase ligase N-terminal domain-containing protein [Maioricimonas rarisocia]QDU38141.1 ATP-dependent DNA ligase [Maioricimonas rarisocia]
MPRFVILTHDHPFLHWDLMLEADGALRTWRLLDEPQPDVPLRAEALPDHRIAYLDYEGPVSRGRGQVTRWDAGTYDEDAPGEFKRAIAVHGSRLSATAVLEQRAEGLCWTFHT